MLKRILYVLSFIVVALAGVLLFNTFRSVAWPVHKAPLQKTLPAGAILHMSRAIPIATISPEDTLRIDSSVFNTFRVFLEQSYPLVHQQLNRTIINGYSYVFEWRGSDSTLPPVILMGHYDVVPVEPSAIKMWRVPPFAGEVINDTIREEVL